MKKLFKFLLIFYFLFFSLSLSSNEYKPKIEELFSKKYTKILDVDGNKADLKYFDRISSLVQIEGPNKEKIIICGLGARDYDASSFPIGNELLVKNSIIRSTDGGKTWTAITPKNKTDRKVYGMSANDKGVVVAVGGDRGKSCIMSSVDYGKTWEVRLPTTEVGGSALYNSYYSKSRKLFIVPTEKGTYTSENGINWTKGKYQLYMGRNGYVIDELDQIWVASNSLSVLEKGQYKSRIVLTDSNKRKFSTFKYLGNGIMLSLAYNYDGSATSQEKTVTKCKRESNVLFLTIPNHGFTKGYLSMKVERNSPIYTPIQNGLEFLSVSKNVIRMNQKGENVEEFSCSFKVRVIAKNKVNSARIYRSTDYGKTWSSYLLPGLVWHSSNFIWSRDFTYVGNGIVYLNFPGWENNPENECAMILKSVDYGQTWKLTDDIVASNNEKINAIYRSINNSDGSLLLGCQDHCRLLKIIK